MATKYYIIIFAFITLLSTIICTTIESTSPKIRQKRQLSSETTTRTTTTEHTRQLLLDFHGKPTVIFNQDFTILANIVIQEYNKATQELCADASSIPVMLETEFLPNLVNGYGAEPRNIAGNMDFTFVVNTKYTCPDCIVDEELELIFVDSTSTQSKRRHLKEQEQQTNHLQTKQKLSSSSSLLLPTNEIESSFSFKNNHHKKRKLSNDVCVPDSQYFIDLFNQAIADEASSTTTIMNGYRSLTRVTELEAPPPATRTTLTQIQTFSSQIEMTMKGNPIGEIGLDNWRAMEEMIVESYNQVNALNGDICDLKSRVAVLATAAFSHRINFDEWSIQVEISGYCRDCQDEMDILTMEEEDDGDSPSRRFLQQNEDLLLHQRRRLQRGGGRTNQQDGGIRVDGPTRGNEQEQEQEEDDTTTTETESDPVKEAQSHRPLLVSSFCPISAKRQGLPTRLEFLATVDQTIINANQASGDDVYADTPPETSRSSQQQITTLDFLSGVVYPTCCGGYNKDWKPVDVNGIEFADAIRQYKNDPMSSPYGSQINCWDVSQVTDMSYAFNGLEDFNDDLSCWDTSNVENMLGMFRSASRFNQNIGMWNVSKVAKMNHMFQSATKFNKDLSDWDISSVTTISAMFRWAENFDQDLCAWTAKDGHIEFASVAFEGSACDGADTQPVIGIGPYCHFC